MKDLHEEQRKMRERMQATERKKTATSTKSNLHAEPPDTKDIQALLKRVEVLEAENTLLRRQLSELRDQSVPSKRRSEISENERRHLFMKYSNVRQF